MRLGLGLHITGFRAGGGFSPADLFASGEQGVWYDPSPSTCFKATWTGSEFTDITAASAGDPVAIINDSSGNGNNATQPTINSRPILRQTGGGLYYLEFDGTDDGMRTSNGVLNTASVTFSSAFSNVTNPSNCFGLPQESAAHTNPFYRFMLFRNGTGLCNVRVNGTDQGLTTAFPDVTSVFTLSNKAGSLRIDGADVETGISTADLTYPNSVPLLIGQNAAGNENAEMNFYAFVGIDRQLTAGEQSNLENYLANLSGVTL